MTWLAQLVVPLNAALFTLGNDHVSVAELLGFVTGAASVWLTVLARISNFGVGIANSAFFLVLFLTARLYADSGLQVVYLVPGFTGWWQWLHGGQDRGALAVAAQFLLNAKKIENWAFWIAADLIYIPLYVVKRLDLTAIVSVLFLGLCGAGVTDWRRGLQPDGQACATVATAVREAS